MKRLTDYGPINFFFFSCGFKEGRNEGKKGGKDNFMHIFKDVLLRLNGESKTKVTIVLSTFLSCCCEDEIKLSVEKRKMAYDYVYLYEELMRGMNSAGKNGLTTD